jgi:hypothetical protein
LYIWIHVGLLFMLPLLGILIWMLLHGIENRAATVVRVLLPVALVFYGAFDSLVGIVAGMLAHEAMHMTGMASVGAAALAESWMEIPMPLPVISTIGVVSWTVVLLAAAVAHRQAGSSWVVVVGLALAGPLFGFGHPFITGVIGMAGLLPPRLPWNWAGVLKQQSDNTLSDMPFGCCVFARLLITIELPPRSSWGSALR